MNHIRWGPLREQVAGRVHLRQDSTFEEARQLFNGAVRTMPQAIVQCTDVADVTTALRFARQHELEVSVRGGGHSVAGTSLAQDGLVIDLRRMNAVTVDPRHRTVTAGGGAVWGDVDRATQPHALATTGGRVSTTGVAGLTLGGGSGWLERRFGLACDNLVSADLITADGARVTANSEENSDLFWALHGGGGNFGIAVSLTLRVHPLPLFSMALLLWPGARGEQVTAVYRDFMAGADESVGGGLLFLTGPPEPFVPEDLQGQLCCGVLVTLTDSVDELRPRIEPLLGMRPEGQVIAEIPYADLQSMLDDPPGYRNYWSADYMRELPDEAIRRFCACADDMIMPSPSQQALLPWGGAVAADGSTPMANRDAPWVVHPLGLWDDADDDEAARRWAHGIRDEMREWSTGATYLNFIGDEGLSRVIAGFGQDNYNRLAEIKARYDPDNVFHRWHNVRPHAAAR